MIFVCLILTFLSSTLNALTLDRAITLAQQNSYEIKEQMHLLRMAELDSDSVEQVYDSMIYGETSGSLEKRDEQSSSYPMPWADRRYSIGFKKLLGWGISAEGNVIVEKIGEPMSLSPATPTTHTAISQFSLAMDLWKGSLSRDVGLQKKIKAIEIAKARSRVHLVSQKVAFQTENLYWQLGLLNEQLKIAAKLLETTRQYAAAVANRVVFGRADEVAVADAESEVVSQETYLMGLQVGYEQIARELSYRIYGKYHEFDTKSVRLEEALTLSLPTKSQWHAVEIAYRGRYDFKMIEKEKEGVRLQMKLAREQLEPSLSLFATLARPGEGNRFQTALDDSSWRSRVGLKFEINLGHRKLKSEVKIAASHLQKLETIALRKRQDIAASLEISYIDWHGVNRQLSQKADQMIKLRHKEEVEGRKMSQARSDQAVVLSYQRQVLRANLEKLAILKKKYDIVARMRYTLHGYPVRFQ